MSVCGGYVGTNSAAGGVRVQRGKGLLPGRSHGRARVKDMSQGRAKRHGAGTRAARQGRAKRMVLVHGQGTSARAKYLSQAVHTRQSKSTCAPLGIALAFDGDPSVCSSWTYGRQSVPSSSPTW